MDIIDNETIIESGESREKAANGTYTTEEGVQRVLLASLDTGEPDFEQSLEELRELAETAGAEVIGVLTQKLSVPNAAACFGSGRLEEMKDFCQNNEINLVIIDRELSPVQIRNIEKATDTRVIDRTMLILDIFAQRARSNEGKLQVELAQLKYMLPRLTGKGIEMSRQGAGIGTRGPGETKLETDRRHIRERTERLKARLDEIDSRRSMLRKRRKKNGVVIAAIVGYTNAGKSTLLNRLTDAGVLAEDKLFATLDPTSRALTLPSGASITLVDTVGFIRRLPHHLVEAFKSTLEEAMEADLIILLCDGSDENIRSQLEVSQKLLGELGAGAKPTVTVINKCDKAANVDFLDIKGVRISALTGEGIDELLKAVDEALPVQMRRVKLQFPFSQLGKAALARSGGDVLSEKYSENGLLLDAVLDPICIAKLSDFISLEDTDNE